MTDSLSITCKPFLKWVGGKRQLLPQINRYLPEVSENYIEPFVGGGAVYFSSNYSSNIISDMNPDLINTYKVIRDELADLIESLSKHKNEKEYFYEMRSLDRSLLSNVEKASRFIFLNKTCFNGLYRVNKKGRFNVPYGKNKSNILDENTLMAASRKLQGTIIKHEPFDSIVEQYCVKNSFVFLDPPYVPVGEFSDFNRYTKESFGKEDHERLLEIVNIIDTRGAKFVLTYSNSSYIKEMYKDYDIVIHDTKRMINSNSKKRKGQDIIITNC